MTSLNLNDLNLLRDFVNLKKNNPKEYKEFLDGVEEIMFDLINISKRIEEKLR